MRSRGTRRLAMDMMTLLFLSMVAVVYILLAYLNIPKDQEAEDPRRQGNLIVMLSWPDNYDTDVDLWVRAEADMTVVGYSNKGGPLFNLLRDDLGSYGDISGRNEEEAITRGIPDGEYIVNAHLFNLKAGELPMPVRLLVYLKPKVKASDPDKNPSAKLLFTVEGNLKFDGHELTLARFHIKDGAYLSDSFNTNSIAIRSIEQRPHP